ncbi:MAG: acyl transferase [Lutibacter sp.]|uniref:LuxE/PaaK family acyltransferase n=1 Tax=Lutibacter sp. TaxID=1925666 RepID=UPI00184B8B2E|nr:acyl transferase [Lutibacter sp.]MBT8317146.1 acyl transferase [Lutibacter sp.]NNJ58006.1 acyl transferase [Lutibacter sp.]
MKRNSIFSIDKSIDFSKRALEIFHFQAKNCTVYKEFLNLLNINTVEVKTISQIPFLPIQFFKSHKILSSNKAVEQIFLSSGTTGNQQSKHFVTDISVYEESFTKGFEYFYGPIENYTVLALLPSYLEREGSSLIYMATQFIEKSKNSKSGFYLNNLDELAQLLKLLDRSDENILLIGVSFALLDLVEQYSFKLKNTVIMETGGMKGRRKELIREELHQILKRGFGVQNIHSEYGMTELLSQAYSKGKGVFDVPPWMKILIRDTEDALTILPEGKTGGINIIDLSNINSCSFIATQDLGKTYTNGTFEVLGRFDDSDIRGCNLMVL